MGSLLGPAHCVALVGASERSFFARFALHNLRAQGYAGELWPVNPRAAEVLGLRAYRSIADLPAAPDLGVVALAPERCLEAVRELADAGTRVVIVLSDGFAETGREPGIGYERALAELCRARALTLIGPNCVGAADFRLRLVCLGQPIPGRVAAGAVSIVSQSGGLLTSVLDAIVGEGLGADLCLSIGNGTCFDAVDGLAAAIERDTTRAVCAYVESFGSDIARLEAVLARARDLGKPVALVKVGQTDLGRRIALSHTATIAGPDHYLDALLRQYGALRCADIEEMARVVAVALQVGALGRRGVAVLGGSGGTAGLVGDLVASVPMPLARFSRATVARLKSVVPDSGFAGNPLDLSGRAAGSPEIEAAYDAIFADPDVGAVLLPFSVTLPDEQPERVAHRDYLELLAGKSDASDKPLVVATLVAQPRPGWVDGLVARHAHTSVYIGLRSTMAALARLGVPRPVRPGRPAAHHAVSTVLSEADGRQRLEAIGFPVMPGQVCSNVGAAARALAHLGAPVVLKAVLPGQAHKSRLGGVEVGLATPAQVRDAWTSITARTSARAVLVERMVGGLELLVGLERDPDHGVALTLGLGGALTETVGAHATQVLRRGLRPSLPELIRLAGLEALFARLPLDTRRRLAQAVALLSREFVSGALRDCRSVEVNPLFVTPAGEVLAADVLIVLGVA